MHEPSPISLEIVAADITAALREHDPEVAITLPDLAPFAGPPPSRFRRVEGQQTLLVHVHERRGEHAFERLYA